MVFVVNGTPQPGTATLMVIFGLPSLGRSLKALRVSAQASRSLLLRIYESSCHNPETIWGLPKKRGPIFGSPYNKSLTILGYILGPLSFGVSHLIYYVFVIR